MNSSIKSAEADPLKKNKNCHNLSATPKKTRKSHQLESYMNSNVDGVGRADTEENQAKRVRGYRTPRLCKKNSKFTDFFCALNDQDDDHITKGNELTEEDRDAWQHHVDTDRNSDDDEDENDGSDSDNMETLISKEIAIELDEEFGMPAKKRKGRPRVNFADGKDCDLIKKYSCRVCGKKYSTPYTLKDHQKIHDGELYICDHCGNTFASKAGFRQHQLYHVGEEEGLFKCNKCMYVVKNESLLEEHYKSRHDQGRPKNHVCDVCGKAFYTYHQLERHLLHHAENKPFKCDLCSFETILPNYLAKHHYNVHAEGNDRQVFQCEICKVILRSKGTYRDHLQRHFRFHRKKCDQCQKTFPNASQLAAHKRSHQQPTLPCHICGKLLRNKHKLKEHLIVHSGEKDLQCPYCPYATYARHNMKKHCLNKHSVNYPPEKMARIQKFDPLQVLNENTVRDPVAIECVKRVQVTKQKKEDGSDECIINDDIIFDDSLSRYKQSNSIYSPDYSDANPLAGSPSDVNETSDCEEHKFGMLPDGISSMKSNGFSNREKVVESKISIRPVGLDVDEYLNVYSLKQEPPIQKSETLKQIQKSEPLQSNSFTSGIHIRPFLKQEVVSPQVSVTSLSSASPVLASATMTLPLTSHAKKIIVLEVPQSLIKVREGCSYFSTNNH